MGEFNFSDHPHRRYNPLTGEWVLVSPHRAKRPWQGQIEKNDIKILPFYDPDCYLCPGNIRAGGKINPKYTDTFVFSNDFSSILPDTPVGGINEKDLFIADTENGLCKVICFSHLHNLTVPEMKQEKVRKVIDVWVNEYEELGKIDFINYIQIFENKGSMMGCSNPHPHCQIWSQKYLPVEIEKEQKHQENYFKNHNRTLLADYLEAEISKCERVICSNNSFIALVPFWAVWPFEAMIISKRPVSNLLELNDKEKDDFADIYIQLTIRYDNLFEISFPYSMGIHQAPTDGKQHPEWHMHLHFYPPLLRSATVKKFMVGYEMLGEAQRDITPEKSASLLRGLSDTHYKSTI